MMIGMEQPTNIWDKIFIHATQKDIYVSGNRFARAAVSVLRTETEVWEEVPRGRI
jgi:PhoPQ-activated pathogenicity-related protein